MEATVTYTSVNRMVAVRPSITASSTLGLPSPRRAPGAAIEIAMDRAMSLRNANLIEEAIAVNHGQVGKAATLKRYQDHLAHFDAYLSSAHRVSMIGAKRKHIALFMAHLEKPGGDEPHEARKCCEWCADRSFPDGRKGPGWSASYRKSYLSAIRFLYMHCLHEDELPDVDPAAHLTGPKVVLEQGYTPTAEEVQRIFKAPGGPRDRLLAHWAFYAPSDRKITLRQPPPRG